jgi:4-hydroxybenzoate polyprenyltransferase
MGSFLRKMLKKRGLGVNLLASVAFLFLMVYGFDLPVNTLGSYLLTAVILLVIVVGSAALAGYLLRRLLDRKDD